MQLGAGLNTDSAKLQRALEQAEPTGETSLVDGVYSAMMLGESDAGRALIIVFSDGLAEACPELFDDRFTLAAHAGLSSDAASLVRDLIDRATQIKPLPDDLTVVVLRRQTPQQMKTRDPDIHASAA